MQTLPKDLRDRLLKKEYQDKYTVRIERRLRIAGCYLKNGITEAVPRHNEVKEPPGGCPRIAIVARARLVKRDFSII
jgi:hypothetical protein